MENYQINKILIPVDFSAMSVQVIQAAINICKRQHATAGLVHVVEPASPSLPQQPESILLSDRIKQASETLNQLAKEIRMNHDIVVTNIVHAGLPATEICYWAKKTKADLIVLGAHSFAHDRESFLGSNAHEVVRNAPCPVMIIRPDGLAKDPP